MSSSDDAPQTPNRAPLQRQDGRTDLDARPALERQDGRTDLNARPPLQRQGASPALVQPAAAPAAPPPPPPGGVAPDSPAGAPPTPIDAAAPDAAARIASYAQANDREHPVRYICEGGETIELIAAKFGILHHEVITGHEENRRVFTHPAWVEVRDRGQKAAVRADAGWDFDRDGQHTTPSFQPYAAGAHPGYLARGTEIYIPAVTTQHLLSVSQKTRQGSPLLRLQLRTASGSPEIPRDWARLLAMELSLMAYAGISGEKGVKTKALHKWESTKHHIWTYEKKRVGAALAVMGATTTLAVSVGSGGLVPAALLAVGLASWTTRKLIDFAIEREHQKELRGYYERALFDEQGRVVSDPNRHFNLLQRHVERLRADVDHDASQGRMLATDAATAIRKCVTHMRKAQGLREGADWQAFAAHDGRFQTCDELFAKAQHGLHLLHEIDKFKTYLLPAITHLVWFMDLYGTVLSEWAAVRDAYEVPVLEYMRAGDHAFCEDEGSILSYIDDDHAWQKAVDAAQTKGRPRRCMRAATGPSDAQRDELWEQLTAASSGSLACSYAPTQGEELTVVGLCLRRARQRLAGVGAELQGTIRLTKAWSRAYPERQREHDALPAWQQRFELFKRDLAERYDHPDLWDQALHSAEHSYKGRTKREIAEGILNETLALSAMVLGGAYLGQVWSEVVVPGESLLDQATKKGVTYSGRYLVGLGITSGIPKLVDEVQKQQGTAPPSYVKRDRTLLLPDSSDRFDLASAGAIHDQLADDPDGTKHRDAGLQAAKAFLRIERHLQLANERLAELQGRVAAAPGGQLQLRTCGQAYAYLEGLMAFHYELDKVERCLVGTLSVVDDLIQHASDLTAFEDEVLGLFEFFPGHGPAPRRGVHFEEQPDLAAGGPSPLSARGRAEAATLSKGRVKEWFWRSREPDAHETCKKVCYGPAPGAPESPRKRVAHHQDPVAVTFVQTSSSLQVDSDLTAKVHLRADPPLGRFQGRARVRVRVVDYERPDEDLLVGEHEAALREETSVLLRFKPEARGRTGVVRLEPLEYCTTPQPELGALVVIGKLPRALIASTGEPRRGDVRFWRWKVDVGLLLDPPLDAQHKKAHVRVKVYAGDPPAPGAKPSGQPVAQAVVAFRERAFESFTLEEAGPYYAVLEPVERCVVAPDDAPVRWHLTKG